MRGPIRAFAMSAPEPHKDAPRRGLRRRSVQVALGVLLALISSAIYAPFLANDAPYYLDAVDVRACRSAATTLEPITRDWNARLFTAARTKVEAQATRDVLDAHQALEARDALTRETQAITIRLATLRRHLRADDPRLAALQEFELALRGWTNNVIERDVDDLGPSSRVVLGAAQLRADFDDVARGDAAPGTLRSRAWFPLFSRIAWSDWWLFWAWSGTLVLWFRRANVRRFAAWLAVCALLAWLCTAGFRQPAMLRSPSIKDGLRNGDLSARASVFAPLRFGFDETNLTEIHRPPSWWPSSEIDERGHYVRGPRQFDNALRQGFEPTATPVEVRFAEPARNSIARHWMGTDALGRDVLTRVLWGGRSSLAVAAAATVLVSVFGVFFGAVAGYFRGWVDTLITALITLLQSFPSFLLMLAAVAIGLDGEWGRALSPLWFVVAVIGVLGWTGIARLVRAEVLRVRELDYVAAAQALGFSHVRVLLRHVVPNSIAPALVAAAFAAATAILTESAVSFFGFGVRAPTPSWGAVMQSERGLAHLWTFLFPGLAVFATCASCAWIGDALRSVFDPREDA